MFQYVENNTCAYSLYGVWWHNDVTMFHRWTSWHYYVAHFILPCATGCSLLRWHLARLNPLQNYTSPPLPNTSKPFKGTLRQRKKLGNYEVRRSLVLMIWWTIANEKQCQKSMQRVRDQHWLGKLAGLNSIEGHSEESALKIIIHHHTVNMLTVLTVCYWVAAVQYWPTICSWRSVPNYNFHQQGAKHVWKENI